MTLTIKSFRPHKTALILGIIIALVSLLFMIPMAIVMSFIPATDQNGNPVNAVFPAVMFFAAPLFYFVITYLFALMSTFLYNRISKNIGGITIVVEEEKS